MNEAPAPWNGWPPAEHIKVTLHWLEHPHHGTRTAIWLDGAMLWLPPMRDSKSTIKPLEIAMEGWRWVAPARVEDAQQRDALLSALKVITEHYSDLMDSGDVLGPRVRHADIPEIAQAVAAIAKAEGRA